MGNKKSQEQGAYPCIAEPSEGSNNLLPFFLIFLVTQEGVESVSSMLSEPAVVSPSSREEPKSEIMYLKVDALMGQSLVGAGQETKHSKKEKKEEIK